MAQNSDPRKRRFGPGRPFPKGVSGNPGGRPRFAELSKAMRAALGDPANPKDPHGPTNAEVIARRLIEMTRITADVQAVNCLRDSTEGKPSQSVELTGANGAALIPEPELQEKLLHLLDLVAKHRGK